MLGEPRILEELRPWQINLTVLQIYDITSLKGPGIKGADLRDFGKSVLIG